MIAKFEKYLVKEMDMMRVMKERVAVVIPYYHSDLSDLEKISFHNCLSILGEHPIILVVPEKIPQERYPLKEGVSYEVVPNEWLKSVDTYNEMMMLKEFYYRFIRYEYILLFQLDAFVFSDTLEYFCRMEYDYIGAPWLYGIKSLNTNRGVVYVGNGGFSLRRISAFLNVLDREKIQYKNDNEDFFWSSQESEVFRVAPIDVALKFAFEKQVRKCFELNQNKLPFGSHAWEKYDFAFWKPYISQMGYQVTVDNNGEMDKEYENERDYHYLESDESSIKHSIHFLQKNGKYHKICIWGAGSIGKECCWLLQKCKKWSLMIADSNSSLWGKSIWDKEIEPPERLKCSDGRIYVIIAVKNAWWEILSWLEAYGFRYGENVILYDEFIRILESIRSKTRYESQK